MKRILLAIAIAASVLATNVPAYAEQNIDCTVVTRRTSHCASSRIRGRAPTTADDRIGEEAVAQMR
jgi:hypothetical protein